MIINENDQAASKVDVDVKSDPTPEYVKRLSQAIRSEQGAISEYQSILEEPSLPSDIREIVSEIMEDEKDHMVLLASAVNMEIQKVFPNNTSELDDSEVNKDVVKESVGDSNRISLSIEKISSDSLAETQTYRISSELFCKDSKEAAEIELRNAIDDFNDTHEDTLNFLSCDSENVTVSLKAQHAVDVPYARTVMKDIADRCDNIDY